MGNDVSSTNGKSRKLRHPGAKSASAPVKKTDPKPKPEASAKTNANSKTVAGSNGDKPSKVTMQGSADTFSGSKPKKGPDLLKGPVLITDALSDVRVKYHINPKEIGHGHYGVVRKCMDRESMKWLAIKSIRKAKVGKIEVLKREIEILREVRHPNIVEFVEVYEDAKYLHLITELCTGGELFDRIIAKTHSVEGHFSERDAAKLIRDILDAIAYCHDSKGIVHRDLKPENFLYKTADEDSPIKIIDFGLSRHDTQAGIMKTKVGTPYYCAPEVLRREYTRACDIWSIGVIAYILLCGYPPFYGDTDTEIFESVKIGRFDFPSPDWDDISKNAKEFICALLQLNPGERLTAAQAMKHEWIREHVDGIVNVPKRVSHMSGRGDTFRKFMAMNKLKKVALADIANSLTHEEIGSLFDVFQAIDKDRDGTMSLRDLDEALASGQFPSQVRENLKDLREDLSISDSDTLKWKEFLAATMDKNLAMRDDKVRMVFDHFRKEGNNYIMISDLTEMMGGEAQARDIMSYIDSDGDGRISYEDFQTAFRESLENDK